MQHNAAFLLQQLGHTAKGAGDLAAARQYYNESLEIFTAIGSPLAKQVEENLQTLE